MGYRVLALGMVLTAVVVIGIRAGLCLPYRNVYVVKVALGPGIEVRPALAAHGGEPFTQMVKRLKPYAAINGTFYDTAGRPLGDILIAGRLVNRGHYPNAIAFKRAGRVDFIRARRGVFRWRTYKAGLAAGPRLVHDGRVALDPVADGFSRRSLTLSAYRSGVGRTRKNELLLVTTKDTMTLAEFAKVMRGLGAVEALNLDGGGACGLYYNGRFLAEPLLPMTNILTLYKR